MVVDEAVLALTGYRLPDPLDVFYARRDAGVSDYRLRAHVLLAAPGRPRRRRPTPCSEGVVARRRARAWQSALPASAAPRRWRRKAMADEAKAAAPIRMRTDFTALALFAASVPLDARGPRAACR